MSDIQTDMRIENGYIYGTLKYCDNVTAISGQPAELLSHGYYFILHIEAPEGYTLSGVAINAPYSPIQPYSGYPDTWVVHASSLSSEREEEDEFFDLTIRITATHDDSQESMVTVYRANGTTLSIYSDT